MMRTAILAVTLCLAGVLAAGTYHPHTFDAPSDRTDPSSDGFSIHYLLKNNSKFTSGGPILYGVGGRVKVEDLQSQYNFFDNLDEFNKALVVYVEQRNFGKSTVKTITNLKDLGQLNLDSVIEDHVAIITYLKDTLHSNNFLVFGGGHGAIIATYLAARFQNDANLKKNFNVLAWSSSPPIKYIRRTDGNTLDVTEISTQFDTLLTDAGCAAGDINKFVNVFNGIKAWDTSTAGGFNGLNLIPAPIPKAPAAATPSNDQLELVLFLRNKMLDLAFEPYSFVTGTNALRDRTLKTLCNAVTAVNTANTVTVDQLNTILGVFGATNANKLSWKVSDGGVINQDLVKVRYQDCTEYQIPYCVPATGHALSGSHITAAPCTDETTYTEAIKSECRIYFRDTPFGTDGTNFDPAPKRLNTTKYPATIKSHLLTTVNKLSLFGANSDNNFAEEAKGGEASMYYQLPYTDNWEFQAPHDCDGKKIPAVRYLALRAFGCLGEFVVTKGTNNADFCNDKTKLFNATIDDNITGKPTTCGLDGTPTGKFPFGQPDLGFTRPTPKVPTKPPTTAPTSPTTAAPTTKAGVGFLPSAMIVLSSAFLVYFTTL